MRLSVFNHKPDVRSRYHEMPRPRSSSGGLSMSYGPVPFAAGVKLGERGG